MDNLTLRARGRSVDWLDGVSRTATDEAKSEYVASNSDILRDQAKAFYTGIVNAIEPTITVEFEFSQQ